MLRKYIFRWKGNNPLPYVIVDKRVNNLICGILITLAPITLFKKLFWINIFVQEDLEFHLKPFGSILDKGNEAYSKKWYELVRPITNFNKDFISGRIEVKQIHEDSSSTKYLLLNNILAK